MDAVMKSDRDGHWIKISVASKAKEENPFWSSSEKSKKQEQKTNVVQSAVTSETEFSRSAPNAARRDKVR